MSDWSRDNGMVGILALCDTLHCSNDGASEPLSPLEEPRIRRILNDRLKHWTPSTCPFDVAARQLIVAVLTEPDWQGRQWSYLYSNDGLPCPK